MKNLIKLFVPFSIIFLSGCATLAPNYSPDFSAIDGLRNANLQKLDVGDFQPRDPNAKVNKISIRAANLIAKEGSFALYVENAIRSDLKEAGLLDSTSSTKLKATITQNDLDITKFTTGSGVMEAELTISKNGNQTFKKSYIVKTVFDSSFLGGVAIGNAQAHYPSLVRTLLQKIYTDQDFMNALK
jgi:hypothetical protein